MILTVIAIALTVAVIVWAPWFVKRANAEREQLDNSFLRED